MITSKEFDALENRDVDALIAEKVMGMEIQRWAAIAKITYQGFIDIPNYSHDLNACREMEKRLQVLENENLEILNDYAMALWEIVGASFCWEELDTGSFMKITHCELVEACAKYLEKKKRCFPVVKEFTCYGIFEQPDVLGFNGSVGFLVECKISRSDFKRDGNKRHRTQGMKLGHYRYYAAPKGMLKKSELLWGFGLLEWDGKNILETWSSTKFNEDVHKSGHTSILISLLKRINFHSPEALKKGMMPYGMIAHEIAALEKQRKAERAAAREERKRSKLATIESKLCQDQSKLA